MPSVHQSISTSVSTSVSTSISQSIHQSMHQSVSTSVTASVGQSDRCASSMAGHRLAGPQTIWQMPGRGFGRWAPGASTPDIWHTSIACGRRILPIRIMGRLIAQAPASMSSPHSLPAYCRGAVTSTRLPQSGRSSSPDTVHRTGR